MTKDTTVGDIMTRKVQVAQIDDALSDVRAILMKGRFHHAPIVDGNRLVGIISSRDFIRIHRELSATGFESNIDDMIDAAKTIKETMKTHLVTLNVNESYERAIDLLAEGEIHSVLVVDDDGHLAGIVTNVDLLDFLFD